MTNNNKELFKATATIKLDGFEEMNEQLDILEAKATALLAIVEKISDHNTGGKPVEFKFDAVPMTPRETMEAIEDQYLKGCLLGNAIQDKEKEKASDKPAETKEKEEKISVQEILGKQLQLLAERAENRKENTIDLTRITESMVRIADWFNPW